MTILPKKESILLYASRGHAVSAEKASASEGCADTIGVAYTTPSDHFSQMWDIWGCGKDLIDVNTRTYLVLRSLEEHGFLRSISTAQELSDFIYQNAHLIAYAIKEQSDQQVRAVDPMANKVMDLCKDYLSYLDASGYIEPVMGMDSVLSYMREQDIRFAEPFVLEDVWKRLYVDLLGMQCEQSSFQGMIDKERKQDLILCSGKSACLPSALRYLDEQLTGTEVSSAIWFTERPLDAIRAIQSNSMLQNVSVGFVDTLHFSETQLGRYLAACRLLMEGSHSLDWKSPASDVALSPYSHLSAPIAGEVPDDIVSVRKNFNSYVRRNRILKRSDAVAWLEIISQGFADTKSLLTGSVEDIEEYASRVQSLIFKTFKGLQAQIESSALSYFVSLFNTLKASSASNEDILDLALAGSFRLSLQTPVLCDADHRCAISDDANDTSCEKRLLVVPFGYAREVAPGCFDLSFIDDVSLSAYRAQDRFTYLDKLSLALGASKEDDSVAKVREMFFFAVLSGSKTAFMFSKRDATSEENFVSFPFDEYLKEVFGQDVDIADLSQLDSKGDGCAAAFRVLETNEADLVSGIGRVLDAPALIGDVPYAQRGSLSGAKEAFLYKTEETDIGALPVLSVSSIEKYMSCPYKWFMENRIKVSALDEEFGALERGIFAHKIMEDIFGRLLELPMERRSLSYLSCDEIETMLDDVFSAEMIANREMAPGSGRYVSASKEEELEFSVLKANILACLMKLKEVPSEYKIYGLERPLCRNEEDGFVPVYAGAYIKGKVDRIDRGTLNNSFYVLDYKASLKNHNAGAYLFETVSDTTSNALSHVDEAPKVESFLNPNVYPSHIQTLVYAQLQKRSFQASSVPAKPIGALYISYMNSDPNNLFAGSLSTDAVGLHDLTDPKSYVGLSFESFLNDVEDLISVHVRWLEDGIVRPHPHADNVCGHCPFEWCEGRR